MVAAPDPPERLDDRPRTSPNGDLFLLAANVTSCFLAGIVGIVIGVLDLADNELSTQTFGSFAVGVLAIAVGAGQIVHHRMARRRAERKP